MQIRFKKDIHTSYMVAGPVRGFSRSHFMVRMLLENDIPGLLRVSCENINGSYNLLYNISSKQAFAKVFETKKISFDQLRALLFSLKGLLRSLREYLLDPNHIILKKECIFLDQEGSRFFYCCNPYYKGNLRLQIRELFAGMLSQVDPSEERAVRLIYGMHSAVQSEHFTIDDIMSAYERIAEELLPKVQKVLPPEEPEQQPEPFERTPDPSFGPDYKSRNHTEEPESLPVFQALPDDEEEETSFFQKMRFYLKGKKAMDVLVDVNNREFLSKVRQCGKVPDSRFPSDFPAVLPEEEKPEFEYIAIEDSGFSNMVAEETNYMAGRSASKGTVLLSATGKESHKLVGLHEQQGVRFVIRTFPFTIGKAERDCDAYLDEATISHLHARLYEEGGRYFLEDLNSTNGTFLNEKRLPAYGKMPVKEGDILRFADEEFIFR